MPAPVGFFTDTTICIGCKACQVACHQWNDLPAGRGERTPLPVLSGNSYDNTGSFSDVNWRHVKFIERFNEDRSQAAWLMMSDVCKHCVNAPCLEMCPTGAILRTEFDTVYIHEPACNGCRDCIAACPFGVIHMSETRNVAQKCTFCYDRLREGLPPACAQACPTESIRFGPINNLKRRAEARVQQLHREGEEDAYLYGANNEVLGGLNAFYLLVDTPERYGLPSKPQLPSRSVFRSSFWSIVASILAALGMLFAFRNRTKTLAAQDPQKNPPAPADQHTPSKSEDEKANSDPRSPIPDPRSPNAAEGGQA